jgi:threonine dehydrogenase-like Zn-dependent dehydrogenase
LTGISGEETGVFPVDVARRKELTLQWCRRFRFNYPTALELTASRRVDVASLITHSFPLEHAQEAFDLVCDMKDHVLKASVDQNGAGGS